MSIVASLLVLTCPCPICFGTCCRNQIQNKYMSSKYQWTTSDTCCHRFSWVKYKCKVCLTSVLQDLPSPLQDEDPDLKNASSSSPGQQDAMKIAWRYQNLPKFQVNTILHAETEMNVYPPWSSEKGFHGFVSSLTLCPERAVLFISVWSLLWPLQTYGARSSTTCQDSHVLPAWRATSIYTSQVHTYIDTWKTGYKSLHGKQCL